MATTIAPPGLVQKAPRLPLPFGLNSVIGWRPDSERWQNGVRFEPGTCEPVHGVSNQYCDPEDRVGFPKELDSNLSDLAEANVFGVLGWFNCTPVGYSVADANDLAMEHLISREETRVEQAFWTGDLANVPNLSGANGFTAPTNIGSYALEDGWEAIADLEQWIGENYGSLGVIHMSRQVATLLFKTGDLKSSGGRLYTPLGTPVVAGSGYESDRIVATPALFGYRSEAFNSSATPGDLLDRNTNDLYAIAERLYLLGFDPCGLAEVTITA